VSHIYGLLAVALLAGCSGATPVSVLTEEAGTHADVSSPSPRSRHDAAHPVDAEHPSSADTGHPEAADTGHPTPVDAGSPTVDARSVDATHDVTAPADARPDVIAAMDAAKDVGATAESGADGGGSCEVFGAPGTCISTEACSSMETYSSYPGYCPGPDDIQCCIVTPDVANNPPTPTGYVLMQQSAVTPAMTTWAVMILDDPTDYPMFSTTTMMFGTQLVLARVEWHPPDFQNGAVHRGVTLYVPA
jgi:hypothetical protein